MVNHREKNLIVNTGKKMRKESKHFIERKRHTRKWAGFCNERT